MLKEAARRRRRAQHREFAAESPSVDEWVVRQGGGSARDALSALDQVSAMGGVVEQAQPIDAILDAVCAHDAGAARLRRTTRPLGGCVIVERRDSGC